MLSLRSLYETLYAPRLLLELRSVSNETVPSSSRYFARPINNGYVLFYDVKENVPLAIPGTLGEYFGSTYVKGANSLEGYSHNLNPEELAKAEELVSLGIYSKKEKEEESPEITFKYRKKKPGSESASWRSKEDVPKKAYLYLANDPSFDFLLVDIDRGLVSLDDSWKENLPRRPDVKTSKKTYVIPSGDVGFLSKELGLKKLLSFLVKVDKRVKGDFKVISPDDKYKGLTVSQIISAPRTSDILTSGIDKKLIAYHGTSTKRWNQIQRLGLVPGKFENFYADLVRDYSEYNVYLTMDPRTAENYATRAAILDGGNALVLKIDVPDFSKIVPDEDTIRRVELDRDYVVTRLEDGRTFEIGKQLSFSEAVMVLKGKDAWQQDEEFVAFLRDISSKLSILMNDVVRKISKSGTFAYRGRIPPAFIRKWKEYPKKAYPKSVEVGDVEAYEKTRAEVIGKTKTFESKRMLKSLIREILDVLDVKIR